MANSLTDRLAKLASGDSSSRYNPLQEKEQSLVDLPIEKIAPDPKQPRKQLGDISGLAASISEYGLFSPIIVQAVSLDSYQLIAGERRYKACEKAGLKIIPCIVRTIDEHRKFEYQLIENLHRKDLNPVEEAMSYKSLIDDHNLTQRELSRRVGLSAASINQILRILDLPEKILEGVQTSEQVTKSVLLEIVKESDAKKQLRLWKRAQEGTLTVRTARTAKKPAPSKAKAYTFKIPLKEGAVSLRLEKENASNEDKIKVLERAIEYLKSVPEETGASTRK